MWWTVGSLMGASSVLLGAFGAHGLRARVHDPNKIQSWMTGAHYQLVHSSMIMLSTYAATAGTHNRAALFFSLGNLLFSGSIYALTLLPPDSQWRRVLGPVTPIGGLCYVAGWLYLATQRPTALLGNGVKQL
jgi:uncharacterized membrane protein YgdD (TMEM256/DUF423 family)